jgi:type II secretory pathway component GspD/PulD (secretin)
LLFNSGVEALACPQLKKGNMKVIVVCLSLLVVPVATSFGQKETKGETYTSMDPVGRGKAEENFPPGLLQFTDSDVVQVLDVYRELSHRTVVRSTTLPTAKINLKSETPLTRIEALQALDTVLAQNGIVMIPQGTKFVKAVAKQAAAVECPPVVDLPRDQLPDCGTYITYIVEVKNQKPRDLAQGLQPFAQMPNSILGIDSAGLLILRDLSSNVRRMLQVLERIDKIPVEEAAAQTRKKTKAKIKG